MLCTNSVDHWCAEDLRVVWDEVHIGEDLAEDLHKVGDEVHVGGGLAEDLQIVRDEEQVAGLVDIGLETGT